MSDKEIQSQNRVTIIDYHALFFISNDNPCLTGKLDSQHVFFAIDFSSKIVFTIKPVIIHLRYNLGGCRPSQTTKFE